MVFGPIKAQCNSRHQAGMACHPLAVPGIQVQGAVESVKKEADSILQSSQKQMLVCATIVLSNQQPLTTVSGSLISTGYRWIQILPKL